MQLPVTLATARMLPVRQGGLKYAVPVENVLKTFGARKSDLFTMEGHPAIMFEGQPLSVVALDSLLHFSRNDFLEEIKGNNPDDNRSESDKVPCVVIFSGEERLGLFVDELLDEQEIVFKSLSELLANINIISAATILGTGEICMVLNPRELIHAQRDNTSSIALTTMETEPESKKIILMAEDSLTTRTQIKRILEGAGYEVVTAVDGLDAFSKIGSRPFNALVSDITMPNMDGLALTAKVRQDKKYKDLPVILVTMLASEEDKRKGLEAGANAYISKPAFDQKILLDTLKRLI